MIIGNDIALHNANFNDFIKLIDKDVNQYKTKVNIVETADNEEIESFAKELDADLQSTICIKVDDEEISKEYIGYFFYLAKQNMLSEAGFNEENSTDEDIRLFWENTEI